VRDQGARNAISNFLGGRVSLRTDMVPFCKKLRIFMILQCVGAKTRNPTHYTWLFVMHADTRFISDKSALPNGYPKSRQKQQLLLDDALEKIEPIIKDNDPENTSTRFYRIMQNLHGHYPYLNGGELEALLLGLLKKKRTEIAL
jgi:hypothetical protein